MVRMANGEIPERMWAEIQKVQERRKGNFESVKLRSELIAIGARYGFEEARLVRLGVIAEKRVVSVERY
jgi:hypothetical protein